MFAERWRKHRSSAGVGCRDRGGADQAITRIRTAPACNPQKTAAIDVSAVGATVPDEGTKWPPVSVVMPARNESCHLRAAVLSVLDQDYLGEIELVIALGPSIDGTHTVAAELVALDPRVRVVPNPLGKTPSGLNVAIGHSRHGIIVRVDGHSFLPRDYVRIAVDLLHSTGAANVGGMLYAEGSTAFDKAVACAMASPLGVGSARFRTGGAEGPADTVYLGVFRREVLDRLGGFDEFFERAQDWELNYRIRLAGGLVWFSPRLRVRYRPRRSLSALAKQQFHYGRWRRRLIQRYPETAVFRYLAPPVTVLTILLGCFVGLFFHFFGWIAPGGYMLCVVVGAAYVGRDLDWAGRLWLPLILVTIHFSWATGFL